MSEEGWEVLALVLGLLLLGVAAGVYLSIGAMP
jgi:hypothetical protein